ncbi:MAG: cobaltochelatase subunit CobN [Clostridia bacterium]
MEDERDLARYFIDSSSYVYGDGKQGEQDVEAFVANVRQIDVSRDITSSRKTDGGASSYSARVQGGLQMAARLVGGKEIRQYMGESSAARRFESSGCRTMWRMPLRIRSSMIFGESR